MARAGVSKKEFHLSKALAICLWKELSYKVNWIRFVVKVAIQRKLVAAFLYHTCFRYRGLKLINLDKLCTS